MATSLAISGTAVLNQKCGNIRDQISWITNTSKVKISLKELELKFKSVQNLKKTPNKLCNECYTIIADEDLEEFKNSLVEIKEQLEAIEVSLTDLIKPCSSDEVTSDAAADRSSSIDDKIKLPIWLMMNGNLRF